MEEIYEFREEFSQRVDERDSIFARLRYQKGDGQYEEYYARHPENLALDEKLRAKPFKGGTTGKYYDPLSFNATEGGFSFLGAMTKAKNAPPNPVKTEGTPQQFTEILIGLAKYYGAKHVKIIRTAESHLYSHRGKAHNYGEPVTLDNPHIQKYAIVFSVEMAEDYINTAPAAPMAISVVKGYADIAYIGLMLESVIREYGYVCDTQVNGNNHFPLVTVAQEACLGEMGKSGMIVTKDYGTRIRLGVVTTDLELAETVKERQYIREFCELCNRCKQNCPMKAIQDQRSQYGGQRCMAMWQRNGTDCGVCMDSCPFSHNLPADLTADLSTVQARERLAKYCDENLPQRVPSTDFPDWIQAMFRK